MHFWCPDVFQGAPTEVTTFLSVASKGAAIALLVRFLGAFGNAAITLPSGPAAPHVFAGLASGVAVLGGVTAFWGNLVAYHQRNIKRLLAYSSISHAGYMIMAASVMPLADRLPQGVHSGDIAEAVLFYLLIYLFMNLGAFTLAALVAQKTGSEDIEDYKGLAQRHGLLTALFMIFLLSLFGMPGLGGFMGKVFLAKGVSKLGFGGLVIIAVLLINTLISFFYYMRPIVYMCLKSPGRSLPAFVPNPAGMVLASACGVMILLTGLLPGRLSTRDYGVLAHEPLPRTQASQPVNKPVNEPVKPPVAQPAVGAAQPTQPTPQGPRGL
jgi:NADH-quinone oxidoreductase subunit N